MGLKLILLKTVSEAIELKLGIATKAHSKILLTPDVKAAPPELVADATCVVNITVLFK